MARPARDERGRVVVQVRAEVPAAVPLRDRKPPRTPRYRCLRRLGKRRVEPKAGFTPAVTQRVTQVSERGRGEAGVPPGGTPVLTPAFLPPHSGHRGSRSTLPPPGAYGSSE